jgi:DNA-directed RNA polymerase specialized sigma subunit
MTSRNLFQQFVAEMNDALKGELGVSNQRQSLESLFKMEKEFKKILMSDKKTGAETYIKFMCFVLDITPEALASYRAGDIEKKELDISGNMLSCRVYFREKQATFNSELFKAFHKLRPNMLHKFAINYLFVKWVLQNYKGPHKRSLNKLKKQIEDLRKRICETNLPLAINRAKTFWSAVPESHLEYMDMIQASGEGLLVAIDKFVPPYKTVFRSVAIGRMTLNLSTDYSATMVKMSPKDKRILYRTNKAKRSGKELTQSEVADFVNKSFKGVSQEEIARIESAATNVASLHSAPEGGLPLEQVLASEQSVETECEDRELKAKLAKELKGLTILEVKVLKLKNGDL